jgi:hypothetical protein
MFLASTLFFVSHIQCISEPGKGTGIGTWDREKDRDRDMDRCTNRKGTGTST